MITRIARLCLALMLITLSLSLSPAQTEAAASQFIAKGITTSKVVALTFDDGSDGTNINTILNILETNNVKATFFLTGSGATNHPQSIKNVVAKGHQIGNHSYSHPDFTTLTATQMKDELDRTESYIKNLTGKSTKPYFRAPYGAVNSTVLSGVGAAGYSKTIQWNIDTLDWKGISASEIVTRVTSKIVPGSIVLMHTGAGAKYTPTALPTIISQLKAQGYTFVTVAELLSTPAPNTYVVQAGDTLYKIAAQYGVTMQQLATANNITNYNLIYVGQVLIIPSNNTTNLYTVQPGDTLYKIATQFGTTVANIATENNITNYNLIYAGQVLVIPSNKIVYTVQPGDTLYKIATQYGTTVDKIAADNNITNYNLIYVGQVLNIIR